MCDAINNSRFSRMTQREIEIQKLERTIEVLKEYDPIEPESSLGVSYMTVIIDLRNVLFGLINMNEDEDEDENIEE